MAKSIIIIGGGVAGLSAGVYGQSSGFETQIFELHTIPGGLCTSWTRKGYNIDGCIHWLVGSSPRNPLHKMWQELGAIEGRTIVDHEEHTRIVLQGKTLIVYTNADRFVAHLKELSPSDSSVIDELGAMIKKFSQIDMPIDAPLGIAGLFQSAKTFAKILPYLPDMGKYAGLPVTAFAQRFSDPFLKEAFARIFDLPDFPMVALLMTLGWMHQKSAGYPIGGSLEFAKSIEKRYLELGGQLHYAKRVSRILVKNGKAVGVRLDDGSEHRADHVISAADGHTTLFDMLEGKYTSPKLEAWYKNSHPFPPLVMVSLGIARDLSHEPHSVNHPLETPIHIAMEAHPHMTVQHYGFDPTLAPAGKSVVQVKFKTDYAYWKNLRQDSVAYKAAKTEIAETVINRLNNIYPGIKDQVEMVDVASPTTFERYTNNWKGSFEGWLITTKNAGKSLPKTLPGLKNFCMIGHWMEPGGGLPTVAMTGRHAIQLICHREKVKFKTPHTCTCGSKV